MKSEEGTLMVAMVVALGAIGLILIFAQSAYQEKEASYRTCVEHHSPGDCR